MKSIVGELLSTNLKSAHQWTNTVLKDILNEFRLDEIYNCHRISYKECIYPIMINTKDSGLYNLIRLD